MYLIGKSTPLVDAIDKVTGSGHYVGDIKIAGMLHAKVLRSPYPHARIVSIDTTRARAIPGVKLVITGEDTPANLWGPLFKEHRILAVDRVRFAGEEVAAVVAVDEATALDALDHIHVEYEELPAVFEPELALLEGAPEIHPGTGNLAARIQIERGDVTEGFRRAAAVYEASYDMSYQYPGYLEPMGTVADCDGRDRLTVWTSTQIVFRIRQYLSDALGLPVTNIRVIQPMVGGGFGGKTGQDMNAPIAALLALKLRRPVRLVNNRMEDFVACRPAPPARIWMKMGLSRTGEIVAKDTKIVADNGAYKGTATLSLNNAAIRSDSLHRLENVRMDAQLVYTNKLPTGAFRGMGNPLSTFPLNAHLHMLAEMIGMDPVDVHLRNAIRTGETSVHGWIMGSCGLTECIEKARDAIGWRDKYSRSLGTGPRRRGVGMGAAIHVSGSRSLGANWDGATAIVKINEDGHVTLITGESDIGQGAHTVLSQICAQELGIPLDHVAISHADTDRAPYAIGAISSRITVIAGNAVIMASREARMKLLSIASEALEVSPEDLTIDDGIIHLVGSPAPRMTMAEAAKRHIFRSGGEGIFVRSTYDSPATPPDPKTLIGNPSSGYSFAVQAVEVEVDIETGKVAVLNAVSADDCGRALNPIAVHGQTQGALAQGIGQALYEDMLFEDGRLANSDFADYTMPTAESLPYLHSILVESMEPNGPYGAKGASETAIVPTVGAISNAIYDAVGIRINSSPITPEKILAELRRKRHNEESGDA